MKKSSRQDYQSTSSRFEAERIEQEDEQTNNNRFSSENWRSTLQNRDHSFLFRNTPLSSSSSNHRRPNNNASYLLDDDAAMDAPPVSYNTDGGRTTNDDDAGENDGDDDENDFLTGPTNLMNRTNNFLNHYDPEQEQERQQMMNMNMNMNHNTTGASSSSSSPNNNNRGVSRDFVNHNGFRRRISSSFVLNQSNNNNNNNNNDNNQNQQQQQQGFEEFAPLPDKQQNQQDNTMISIENVSFKIPQQFYQIFKYSSANGLCSPMTHALYFFIASSSSSSSNNNNNQNQTPNQTFMNQQQTAAAASSSSSSSAMIAPQIITSHEDVLDTVASLLSLLTDLWNFSGKIIDSYEAVSHLSPAQVRVLLQFGCFSYSPCRKYLIPNSKNNSSSLVPSLSALADACEKILMVATFQIRNFNNNNNNNQEQEFVRYMQRSNKSSLFCPHNQNQTQNQVTNVNQQQQQSTSSTSSSIPLRFWCNHVSGFGWRQNKDDVGFYCDRASSSQFLFPLDVMVMVDAMLTEAGAPQVVAAMNNNNNNSNPNGKEKFHLISSHDRYGHGIAVILRQSSRIGGNPKKASDWNSSEIFNNNNNTHQEGDQQSAVHDFATSNNINNNNNNFGISSSSSSLLMKNSRFAIRNSLNSMNNNNNNRNHNSMMMMEMRSVSMDGENTPSTTTRVMKKMNHNNNNSSFMSSASSSSSSSHHQPSPPPPLKAQAVSIVTDVGGVLLTVCHVSLLALNQNNNQPLTYEECATPGTAFTSWLGSLTLPSANSDHLVLMCLPSCDINPNAQLVIQTWQSMMGNCGWRLMSITPNSNVYSWNDAPKLFGNNQHHHPYSSSYSNSNDNDDDLLYSSSSSNSTLRNFRNFRFNNNNNNNTSGSSSSSSSRQHQQGPNNQNAQWLIFVRSNSLMKTNNNNNGQSAMNIGVSPEANGLFCLGRK